MSITFALTIPDGCPAFFGRAFLLRQRGSGVLQGSTVESQQGQAPQGACNSTAAQNALEELSNERA